MSLPGGRQTLKENRKLRYTSIGQFNENIGQQFNDPTMYRSLRGIPKKYWWG
jgi:hypothetical protein